MDQDQGPTRPSATDTAASEAAVMEGGPGLPPSTQTAPDTNIPPAPSEETIRLGGEEFQVSAMLAEAVRRREVDAQRKISEQGAELGALRKLQQEPPPSPETPVQSTHLSDEEAGQLLFEKPGEFVNTWMTERIDTAVEAKAQEFRAELYRKDFWQEFYVRYPELQSASAIVETVFRESLSQWGHLQPKEVFDQLAQGTRDAVGKLLHTVTPTSGTARTTVEASSASRVPQTSAPAVPQLSLSELLRKRRKTRLVGR